jgi:hypothetical protein
MKKTPIPIPLYWFVNSYPGIMVYELKSPFNQKKIKKHHHLSLLWYFLHGSRLTTGDDFFQHPVVRPDCRSSYNATNDQTEEVDT